MRISDWSSDVCSSDLFGLERRAIFHAGQRQRRKLVEEFKKVEIELSDAIRDGIGKELLLGREIRAGRIGAAALVAPRIKGIEHGVVGEPQLGLPVEAARSEARRVGKECVGMGRSRWAP